MALSDTIGIVRDIDIDQEMRGAYLDYAMSVIVALRLARCARRPQTCT